MYIVTIKNGEQAVEIHNHKHKLVSGNVVKGINSIDSFSFTATPNNPAFNNVRDFLTLVEVYNTNRKRYEFQGRVLCSTPSMSDKGLLAQEVTCESFFGYLCDSQQLYVEERNWTKRELLTHLINTHNEQTEDYKHFKIGEVYNPTVNVYCGIQRENTWEAIKKKLIESEGGEIRFRVVGDDLFIDYLEQIGEEKSTEIAVSKNMKTIIKEKDSSAFITRLIPLGCKLGDDSEERLDISSVNGGKKYIDDEEGIEAYGIHVGYVEFDDVTEVDNLLRKGKQWMEDNNKVRIKYSITALDLSLIGLDIDDFEVHNSYPVANKYLAINDRGRVTKKNIDICDETKSTMEIGESFKTLSQLQREQYKSLSAINADIVEIRRNYATNQKLANEISKTVSIIDQRDESIILAVSAGKINPEDYDSFEKAAEAAFALKVGRDENEQIVSMLNASADMINLEAKRLTITGDNFTLKDGKITASGGTFNGSFSSSGTWGRVAIEDGILVFYDNKGTSVADIFPSAFDTDSIYKGIQIGGSVRIENGNFYLDNGDIYTNTAEKGITTTVPYTTEYGVTAHMKFVNGILVNEYA